MMLLLIRVSKFVENWPIYLLTNRMICDIIGHKRQEKQPQHSTRRQNHEHPDPAHDPGPCY